MGKATNLKHKFKEKYSLPKMYQSQWVWEGYWEKIEKDNLGYETWDISPAWSDEGDNITILAYSVFGAAFAILSDIFLGFFWGCGAYFVGLATAYIFLRILEYVLFVKIPYNKFCKKEKEFAKEQILKENEQKKAIENGDLSEILDSMKSRFRNLKIDDSVLNTKMEEIFNLADIMVNVSESNETFKIDVSRYINIYIEEIIKSIENNYRNVFSEDIYKKYINEIYSVVDKLILVFNNAIKDAAKVNSIPIDASLKAISNMLDGESIGSEFNNTKQDKK